MAKKLFGQSEIYADPSSFTNLFASFETITRGRYEMQVGSSTRHTGRKHRQLARPKRDLDKDLGTKLEEDLSLMVHITNRTERTGFEPAVGN